MWHVLLILFVIPVAVWILSSLFRAVEEQQRTPQRPRMDGSGRTPPVRPRRPANDIESFLEEINRRRREGTARPKSNRPPGEPAGPSRPRPKPPLRRPASAIPTVTLPASKPRPPAARRVPTAEVVEVVVAEARPAPTRTAQPIEAIVVAAEVVAPALIQQTAPATVAARPVTPNLTALKDMLKSPQKLRTALLLQEVLGPPMCYRRVPRRR